MIICYIVPEIWCVTHETAIFQNFNQVNFYQLFNNIFLKPQNKFSPMISNPVQQHKIVNTFAFKQKVNCEEKPIPYIT